MRTLLALGRTEAAASVNQEVDVRILGHLMRGFGGGSLRYLFDEIFVQNQYAFRPESPSPVIVDCGANVGLSVLYFRIRYPDAKIVAFEANPEAFRLLQHNVSVNRLSNVDLRQVAVGDAEGQIPFFVSTSPGSLLASTRQDRGGSRTTMVAVEPLSKTLARFPRIDLVKMDVEGAEWGVLDDLIRTGTLTKPARYIIEYHHQIVGEPPRLSEFLKPFEDAGYRYHVGARLKSPTSFQDVLLHLTSVG